MDRKGSDPKVCSPISLDFPDETLPGGENGSWFQLGSNDAAWKMRVFEPAGTGALFAVSLPTYRVTRLDKQHIPAFFSTLKSALFPHIPPSE